MPIRHDTNAARIRTLVSESPDVCEHFTSSHLGLKVSATSIMPSNGCVPKDTQHHILQPVR